MADNNRIYYAIQAVKIKSCRETSAGSWTYNGNEYVLRGIQSVGISTTFNLEQVYQLGQLDIYDEIEEIPEIEVTISKALDGMRPVYLHAMDGDTDNSANNKNLNELTDRKCDIALGIYKDTNISASGTAEQYVVCSGMYVTNVTYNLVSDGNLTEDITLVGNYKKWTNTTGGGITSFTSGINNSGELRRVGRRWNVDISSSTFPTGASGGIEVAKHFNSITISAALNRESINELGARAPYYRYMTFPIEVTAELELTSVSGDRVDANDFVGESGCNVSGQNLSYKTLRVEVCAPSGNGNKAYIIDLGDKNKLTSVNYTGGEAGGGNATVTYSYRNFNFLKVSGVSASNS